MNFEFKYTPEQEKFRKEVQEYLDVHVPMDFKISSNPHDTLPGAKYEFIRRGRRKLADKGWLAPMWPREVGGGGLSLEEAVVVQEELAKRPWTYFGIGDFAPSAVNTHGPQLYNMGTEEQKQRWLPGLLTGDIVAIQGYSEPDTGSDLAGVKVTAVRDGDDYIVNGTKRWMGSQFDNADLIFLVAVTDLKAARHRNLSLFYCPMNLPGISKVRVPMMRNCHTGGWEITFKDVRVSGEYLIGGREKENKAWPYLSAAVRLADPQRYLPRGTYVRDRMHDFTLDYVKKTKHNGQLLSQDPDVRAELVEAEVQLETNKLLSLRQNCNIMRGKIGAGYPVHQQVVINKATSAVQGKTYSDVLGPAALMRDPQDWLMDGEIEYAKHQAYVHHVAGTSPEINRMLMARWVCRSGD